MPRASKPSIVQGEPLRAMVTQQFKVSTTLADRRGPQLTVKYQYSTEYDGNEPTPSLWISGRTVEGGSEFWHTEGNNEPAVFVCEDHRVIRTLADMLLRLAERVEAHEIGRDGRA